MPGFVLLVRARDDADPMMRVGITVSKKVGNAVIRNRMKRRFVEEGVFVRPFGRIVYTTPPLVIGEEDLARVTGAMLKVVAESAQG